MSTIAVELVIVLVLILANGLFSMSEIALVSARKTRLQQHAAEGEKRAQTVLKLTENPNRFLSTVQIGISLVGVLAGAVGGATLAGQLAPVIARVPLLAPYADGIALVLVVLFITYLSLVIGELIPKRVALNDPEKVAEATAGMMQGISVIARPFVSLLSASTDLGVRLLGLKPSGEPPVTEDEIRVLMREGTAVGVFEAVEQDIVDSVFRLGDRRVGAIMTQRTDIVWLDLEEPYERNLGLVLESSFSHFPVGDGSLDNVVGILRVKDLLKSLVGEDRPVNLRTLVRQPLFVPESTPAFNVLEQMRSSRVHAALVIDEYGGLQGMVTLNDLLEAIVGDMPAQGEENHPPIVRRDDGSWLVDGLMPIDEFKEAMKLGDLPGEDEAGFQTVGGFVMAQLGSIPTAGQSFTWNEMRFEVMDMDGRRVDKILIVPDRV